MQRDGDHALNYILFLRGLRGLLGAGFRGLVTHPLGELLRGAGAVGQAGQQLTKLGVGNGGRDHIEDAGDKHGISSGVGCQISKHLGFALLCLEMSSE